MQYLWGPEGDTEVSGAGVTGTCEPLDKGAGGQTLVLCKSRRCFLTKDPFFQPRSGVLSTVPAALTEIKDKSGMLSRELETTKEATGEFQTRGKKNGFS